VHEGLPAGKGAPTSRGSLPGSMSTRATRWLLFSLLAVALPVPFFMAALEIAPLVRLLFLEGVMLAIVASDGLAGTTGLFAAILAIEGLLVAAALWGLAWVGARALSSAPPAARVACAGLAAATLLGLSMFRIYRTPHSSRGPTASLLGLFD
jgi:hypothetical protein